jgi:hypothetical protein
MRWKLGTRGGTRTLAIVGFGALMLGSKLGFELLEQLAEAGQGRVAPVLSAPHGHGPTIRRRRKPDWVSGGREGADGSEWLSRSGRGKEGGDGERGSGEAEGKINAAEGLTMEF